MTKPRKEGQATATIHMRRKFGVKFSRVVFEICEWTDKLITLFTPFLGAK